MRLLTQLGRLAVLPAIFLLLGYGVSPHLLLPPSEPGMQEALGQVRQQFHEDLAALEAAAQAYHRAATEQLPPSVLRDRHLTTRLAFKRCEYLLEYLDPQSVKRYLNGAPLPKTEPKVPEIVVIEPVGLQVLDELVFEDRPDYGEITLLTQKLLRTLGDLSPYIKGIPLQHRHVFEGAYEEVIRLFTLGVTGFDTPGSVAALPEAREVLRTLASGYAPYGPYIARLAPRLHERATAAFSAGEAQLAAANFDTFDRLHFLRQVVNPLTEALPRAQDLLGIESSADNTGLPRPVNRTAGSLFAADFLNADYYARLGDGAARQQRTALGELLFFDPVLSESLEMSCASCHRPERAFTDGKPLSVRRNAPTLVNSVFAEKYFYDLREEFLERQVKHVVLDAHEFATNFVTIESRLRQSDTYRRLFAEAYADQPAYQLSSWSISDALTHYVSSLRAFSSPFDRYARGAAETIEPAVRRGFNLFMGKGACATCHFAPTFSGLVPPFYTESESEVLGVPATAAWDSATVDPDLGRVANARPQDEAYFQAYSFKTPTVRNVAVTAPYMHNGVYTDLQQVMDFYNRGGGKGIGIHLEHQTLPFDSLGLQEREIADVITFMESLTDYASLNRRPAKLPTFAENKEWNERYDVGGAAGAKSTGKK